MTEFFYSEDFIESIIIDTKNRIITASHCDIRVWFNRKCEKKIDIQNEFYEHVFSSDCAYFAYQVDFEDVTKVVHIETGTITTFTTTFGVHRLQFLPKNDFLAIATQDGVEFWSLVTYKLIKRLATSVKTEMSLCFSPNCDKLVYWNRGITIWDLETNSERTITQNIITVNSVKFISNDKIAFDSDGIVSIYDLVTCKQLHQMNDAWFVYDCSPNGKTIVLSQRNFEKDYITRLCETENGELQDHDEYSLGFWDVETGKCIRKYNNNDSVIHLKFFQDNNTFLTYKSECLQICKMLDFSKLCFKTITLLMKNVAPYVVRDIINFTIANKEKISFDTECNFLSYQKLLFIINQKMKL